MNEILTVRQVADRLQVNRMTVYRWLHKGRLAGYRANKLWRISEDDLANFLERGTGAGQNTRGASKIDCPELVADLAPNPQGKNEVPKKVSI